MIFSIEPGTRKFVAHLAHDGGVEVYDCTADACTNPVCRCRTTRVALCPRSQSGAAHEVGIDLDTGRIDKVFRKRATPDSLAFAEQLITAMDRDDFELIGKLHHQLKNRICEEAEPGEIKARFNFDEVERSALLQAYNDVLPFGDMFRVKVGDQAFAVLDQFCLKPGCKCTDAFLNLFPVTDDGRAADNTGAVSIDYSAERWERVEGEPLPYSVAEFRQVTELAYADFYRALSARHKKLRAIYAHCRKREYRAIGPTTVAATVGRNDACSCGSGKKFKKCCMGKVAGATSGSTEPQRTSVPAIGRKNSRR